MTCEQLDRFIQALRRELALQAEQAEGIEATVLGRVLEAVRRADTSALGHSNMRALASLARRYCAFVDASGNCMAAAYSDSSYCFRHRKGGSGR